ncbi:MAG: YfiR family protein [Acidobacteriaceae bacterium]
MGILFITITLQAQPLSEYDVEAAYLYNFGKFVRWPANSANEMSSFDICILGQDPFGGTLDKLIANEKVDGKPIRKRVINRTAEAAGCAIVYISDSEAGNLRRIVSALSARGALLVSGLPNFLSEGGMIRFDVAGNRVRFSVNLDPATNCHLVFSSQLLKVAEDVVGKPQNRAVR